MKRIEKLTDKQKAQFPAYVKRWTDIGLSTQPADRKRAEAGVAMAYEAAGLKPPRVVWTTSPLASGLTRATLKLLSEGNSLSVRDSVGASVRDSVWDSVRDSVGDSVGASVRASVGDSVWASVWASVRDSVWDSVRDSVWDSGYGQHDAGWLSFYAFFREVTSLTKETDSLRGLFEIAQSAGWFLPHEHICWISERHNVLHCDRQGRLHNETGPALAYPDGFAIHAWHGLRIPAHLIEQPQSITVEAIDAERNAEIRRVMLEIFGTDRYIQATNAEILHEDEFGRLYRRTFPDDEDLLMVRVVNGTQEPDGSRKEYWLRVDPALRPMLRLADGTTRFRAPPTLHGAKCCCQYLFHDGRRIRAAGAHMSEVRLSLVELDAERDPVCRAVHAALTRLYGAGVADTYYAQLRWLVQRGEVVTDDLVAYLAESYGVGGVDAAHHHR